MNIKIIVSGHTFKAQLNDTPTAEAIYAALPVESRVNTWGDEIYFHIPVSAELETFFKELQLPAKSVKLNEYSKITDLSKFIDSHMATVKANNGNKTFLPYLDRL